ncbi:MAG TPA: hypothetical protein VF407_15960, partial [Polyangiaceae bacterium]
SSDGGSPATNEDGGGGSTGTDDGGGPGTGSTLAHCGDPPYITLSIAVEAVSSTDPKPRVEGAVLTSPNCPDASFTSDADGGIVGLVSQNVPFYGRFNASGYAPTLSPEEKFPTDTSDVFVDLPPSLINIIVPNYDANKPTVFVDVLLDGGHAKDGGANCNDPSGVTFGVVDHPEAIVTYYAPGTVPTAVSGGTSTTSAGIASITGLDSSVGPITLTATKTGCTVATVKDTATGRLPLENGYISIAPVYLHD